MTKLLSAAMSFCVSLPVQLVQVLQFSLHSNLMDILVVW